MEQQFLDVELYVDKRGTSDLLDGMSIKNQTRFIKKTEDFKKLTFDKFLRSKRVETIPNYRGFYELKYYLSDPPYRGIAFIHNKSLVLLLIFKGSGSNHQLDRHLPRAINRASDWKSRN